MTADTLTRDASGCRSRRTVLKGGAAPAGALAAPAIVSSRVLASSGEVTRAVEEKKTWTWRVSGLGLPEGIAQSLLDEMRGES